MFSMFSFDRSGVGVTGASLAAGFCASVWLQLMRKIASKAKTNPVFFMVAVLLKARASRAFTYPDTAATALVHFAGSYRHTKAARRHCREPELSNRSSVVLRMSLLHGALCRGHCGKEACPRTGPTVSDHQPIGCDRSFLRPEV